LCGEISGKEIVISFFEEVMCATKFFRLQPNFVFDLAKVIALEMATLLNLT
jgi:hypothetical protein